MRETTKDELLEAIERFKKKYGIKEPLDNDRLDEIIDEMREEKQKPKKRRKK